MKRQLFFFLDRLQIKRSERITITILMILLLFLSGAWLLITPEPHYSEEEYARLEQIFAERSSIIQQEKHEILMRYQPYGDDLYPELIDIEKIPERELSTTVADTILVNINTADSEELQKLPGIGPAYADRIIAWREENGPFTNVEQLLEVRGIGPARLQNLRHLVEL